MKKFWVLQIFLLSWCTRLTSPLLLRIPENLEAIEAEVALARQVIAELVQRAGQQIDRLQEEEYVVYLDSVSIELTCSI